MSKLEISNKLTFAFKLHSPEVAGSAEESYDIAVRRGTLQWILSMHNGSSDSDGSMLDKFNGKVPKGMTVEQAGTKMWLLLEHIHSQPSRSLALVSFYAAGAFYNIEQSSLGDSFTFNKDEDDGGVYFSADKSTFVVYSGSKKTIRVFSSSSPEFGEKIYNYVQKAEKSNALLKIWYRTGGIVPMIWDVIKTFKGIPDYEEFTLTADHLNV